jgi:hypothetical protein
MNAPVHAHDEGETPAVDSLHAERPQATARAADYWVRTCGVPWERISKAVQAVGQRNFSRSAGRQDSLG